MKARRKEVKGKEGGRKKKNRKERKGNADLDTDTWKRPCG